MHKTNPWLAAVILGLTALQAPAQSIPDNLRSEVETAFHSVSPASIKATMSFLADDLVEGRQPGTRGFAIASRYVETQFMAMGLQPGVDGHSYVQPVLLKKGMPIADGCSLTLGEQKLDYNSDFLVHPNFYEARSAVSASIVFVGYGIYAPELSYDDYGKTDVKGKIIAFLDQAPAAFPSNERAFFSSAATKYAEAVKRGAIGVITISSAANAGASWEAFAKRAAPGSYRWMGPDGQLQEDYAALKVIAALNPAKADLLFSHSGHTWQSVLDNVKTGRPQSFPLGITAAMQVTTNSADVHTSNLVGVIPGSDPHLKDQYVVYTAHLDHFGIGQPVKGDSVFNGAHDNASGVALLLEIARTFRSLPTPPKRSVIITIVTGEEMGLLGSDYYIHHPTVPRSSIVANLSLDMPFFFHPVLDIVPYGADHSSLSNQVKAAAGYMNLGIGPDPFPEQVVFIRSDHYSFIRQGIPALFIKSGFKTVPADTVQRSRTDVDWRRTTYHTPQDDMSQAFDFDAAATHVKLNFLIGLLICEDKDRPSWNTGDFFGGRLSNNH